MFTGWRRSQNAEASYRSMVVTPQEECAAPQPLVDAEFVQQWLSTASRDNLEDVFGTLMTERAEFQDMARSASATAGRGRAVSKACSESSEAMARSPSALIGVVPIVQFSTGKYFCLEGMPTVTVVAMRVGAVDKRTRVKFRTEDKTAVAGVAYVHMEGVIVWEAGEIHQDVSIQLLDDSEWAGVLEFRVVMQEEGAENAILSVCMSETRVQRIDDDIFPSSKYEEQIRGGRLTELHPAALLIEFSKSTFSDKVVRLGTIKMLAVGQLKNVFFILKLFVSAYMVDNILLKPASEDGQARIFALVLLTSFTLVPQAILHYLDYSRFGWRVVGKVRMRVMAGLMNSFLYMSEVARSNTDAGDLVDAMTFDTDKVIKEGYLTILGMFQVLGKIVMCFTFQLLAPLLSGSEKASQMFSIRLFPLVLFPFCTILLMVARAHRTQSALIADQQAKACFVAGVHEVVDNFRLLADFGRRRWAMDRHTDNVMAYAALDRALSETLLNNTYMMKGLTYLVVSSYVLLNGVDVISGEMRCGMFLACLSVCKMMGTLWSSLYDLGIKCVLTSGSLERIVSIINQPCEAKRRMELSTHVHEVGHRITSEMVAEDPTLDESCLDKLPIQVDGMSISLQSRPISRVDVFRTTELFFHGLHIQQGTLVSLVGRHGHGKSTLLRILGGAVPPERQGDESVFFVPPHLRVLHVSQDVMFVEGSLYKNLVLGVQPGTKDGDIQRVRSIVERCGLSQRIVDAIEDSDESPAMSWGDSLSSTEKHLLVLARALIANPELLCLHRPTLHFDDRAAEAIVTLLREFVGKRGVSLDQRTMHLRRPRTCIITSARPKTAMQCDQIFEVRGAATGDAESSAAGQVKPRGPSVVVFDPDHGTVDLRDLAV